MWLSEACPHSLTVEEHWLPPFVLPSSATHLAASVKRRAPAGSAGGGGISNRRYGGTVQGSPLAQIPCFTPQCAHLCCRRSLSVPTETGSILVRKGRALQTSARASAGSVWSSSSFHRPWRVIFILKPLKGRLYSFAFLRSRTWFSNGLIKSAVLRFQRKCPNLWRRSLKRVETKTSWRWRSATGAFPACWTSQDYVGTRFSLLHTRAHVIFAHFSLFFYISAWI